MAFRNNPELRDESNGRKVKRYVHQPLSIEHNGIHAKIKPNGWIVITGLPRNIGGDDVEYDELEVPASLIFKLATLLQATRQEVYVSTGQTSNQSNQSQQSQEAEPVKEKE